MNLAERELYHLVANGLMLIGAIVFVYLFSRAAPYGRHQAGPPRRSVSARTGWMVMEAPSAILVALYFVLRPPPAIEWVYLVLWELHYAYRAFLFPLRMRANDKPMPVLVVASAFVFNLANSYVIGRGYTLEPPPFSLVRLGVGGAVFLFGMWINRRADAMLFALRAPGETGYKIPRGWLYDYISCPNYFGEIVEWIGFAIAMGTHGAWSFAFFTFANLAPRAVAHHRWYKDKFPDYPTERRALIPFLW